MGYCGEWKPVLTMLVVDAVFAAMNTLIKMAIDSGMHPLVAVTLRQLVAVLFMAPIAYFRERKTRPKLTSEILVHLFFGALLGASLTQYLFFLGFKYMSATFSCAFINMVPVFTFLIALPFRMETLNLKSKGGVAKLLGTLISLAGALVLMLYQGAPLFTHNTPSQPMEAHKMGVRLTGPTVRQWTIGSLALLAGSVSWSSWFLVQAQISKKYHALYSGTAIIFFFSFIQASALCFAMEKSLSIWILTKKVEIIAVLFAGILGSGLGFLAMSWCVEKKGPVFTSAFTPLIQIFVAGIDIPVLHEQLHIGSVLGSGLVIAGLYFLLWGKSNEAHTINTCTLNLKPVQEIGGPPQVQLQTV